MGARGPIPKRNAERLGHRTKAEMHDVAPSGTAKPIPAERMKPKPDWHDSVKHWFASIAASGMTQFYEPSDWGQIYLFGDALDREFKPKVVGVDQKMGTAIVEEAPIPPQTLAAILKLSTALGFTEGDRRRMSIELQRSNHEAEEEAQILHLVQKNEDEAFG